MSLGMEVGLSQGHTVLDENPAHDDRVQLEALSHQYAQKNLSVFSLHEWINVRKTARRHNPV